MTALVSSGCTHVQSPDSPDPEGFRLPGTNYASFQMRDCDRSRLTMEAPYSLLEEEIPKAFRPASPTDVALPESTGSVVIEYTSCTDSLNNTDTFGPVQMYRALALVYAENKSWAELPFFHQFYVLDIASDNDAWSEAFDLADLDIEDGTFETTKLDPIPGISIIDRTIKTDQWSTGLKYSIHDEPTGPTSTQQHIWYGDGPYYRMTEESYPEYYGLVNSTTVIDHSGASVLSRVNPAPVWVNSFGIQYTEEHMMITYDGRWHDD